MDTNRIAYTAANSLPLKICKNTLAMERINKKVIQPLHAQVIPTNQCNLNCEFCSCANRNKAQQLSLVQLVKLAAELKELGCLAVTITGGGEPLMHPDFEDIVAAFWSRGIKVGLVTNGLLLARIPAAIYSMITWCRVSCADGRKLDDVTQGILMDAVDRANTVDWAFSYVLSTARAFNADNLAQYVRFANIYEFTHVRVVSDLLNLNHGIPVDWVKKALAIKGVDDGRVIYQGRKEYDPGQTECYLSLLKPVIGADGYIYPCCGAQYALSVEDKDMSPCMRMGHIDGLRTLYERQEWFKGDICVRCYYKNYNDFLGILAQDIPHKEFI